MNAPLVVRPQMPFRQRAALLAAAALGALMIWGVFEWGRRAGGHDAIEAGRARQALADRVMSLQADNETLRREIALMKAAGRVDGEAYGRVSREIDDLQSQIAELNQELAFYRGIMAPAEGTNGLQVQTVQIKPADGEGKFRLSLVLIQAGRQDRRVSGSLQVAVVGSAAGAVSRVQLRDPAGESQDLRFAFRYFQILEADVDIPAEFSPERIDVSLHPDGRGQERMEVSFPWELEEA